MKELDKLELNGKVISEFQVDLYGLEDDELDPASLLFCYAEFEDTQKQLTSKELRTLSKKYPEVIYLLIKDDLPTDSPHHAIYQPLLVDKNYGDYSDDIYYL